MKSNVLSKPMVLDRVVFCASHVTWFEPAEAECANVVLMDLNVKVGQRQGFKIKDVEEFLEEINERKQILARLTECNILSFGCGNANYALHMRSPQYRTPRKIDDVASAAPSAVRVLRMLVSVELRKISVGITVNAIVILRIKYKSFVGSSFEITSNTLESSFMRRLWIEGVACTLMHSEGDVRVTVSTQVEEHSKGTGVVDYSTSGGAVGITRKHVSFCWCGDLR